MTEIKKTCDIGLLGDHRKLSKEEMRNHLQLEVYMHDVNPYNGKYLSFRITPSCQTIMSPSMSLGKFVRAISPLPIQIEPEWIMFVRETSIINNPDNKRHLNFLRRENIKSILQNSGRMPKLVSIAARMRKSDFVKKYPGGGKFWTIVNDRNHIPHEINQLQKTVIHAFDETLALKT